MMIYKNALPAYPAKAKGEDTLVVQELKNTKKIHLFEHEHLYLYIYNGANTWGPKHFGNIFNHDQAETYQDYTGTLKRLSFSMPIHAYEKFVNSTRNDLLREMYEQNALEEIKLAKRCRIQRIIRRIRNHARMARLIYPKSRMRRSIYQILQVLEILEHKMRIFLGA